MSTRPAVVLITTSFPVQGDGSEAAGGFVADLALALARHRPVRVVAPGPVARREAWTEGMEVFRYAAPDRPLSTLKPWHPGDLLAIRRVLAGGQRATREAVESGPTAHLLALWALPCGHWARRVARSAGLPYSVWTLGSDIWTLGRIPLVRGYLHRVLRDADACFADGLLLAEDTRRLARRTVEFLPSTRTLSAKRSSPLKSAAPFNLLFLGRWHPNKGVDLLTRALELLGDADWARISEVRICGGGPLETKVREAVKHLVDAGRPVHMQGYMDKGAAEDALLQADYLLIPSRIESIPVVFSDAMKLDCPVVTTPVGDLPQLTSEGCGISSNAVTPEAYARALQEAMQRSPSEFRDTLPRIARHFSMEDTIVPTLLGRMESAGT